MSPMKMITVDPEEGGVWSFGRKLERALAGFGEQPTLAIVFLPISAPSEKFLEAVSAIVSAPVVGATTGGAASTERGSLAFEAACDP
jgi:hypothetical protein